MIPKNLLEELRKQNLATTEAIAKRKREKLTKGDTK